MVELNEIALENVVGGEVPQCAKFGLGFVAPYAIIGMAAHDAVVSEENRIDRKPRSLSTGVLAGMASYCALSVGAYEGIKFIRRKLKGRK